MSVNKVFLLGRVGKPVEVRDTDKGKVATFTLATSESYKDRDGNKKENTEWHNIVAWKGTAEIAEKFVQKGSQIYLEGKIRTRSWEKDGEKRYVTEIIADNIQLLGSKNSQDTQESQPKKFDPHAVKTTAMPYPEEQCDDDDLPFNWT